MPFGVLAVVTGVAFRVDDPAPALRPPCAEDVPAPGPGLVR